MASPPRGPQHPFWRGFEGQAQPQQADELLIGRLLASARPSGATVPAPVREAHRLVSLPVDHRKNPRVVRLHGPHLDRNLTERDKFDHWRRWMAASKRKELA